MTTPDDYLVMGVDDTMAESIRQGLAKAPHSFTTLPEPWAEVETPWGIMAVNPQDVYVGASVLTYGEFSPAEREFLQGLVGPGDVVVDAGANIGALTLPLAAVVGASGHVLAFEPQPQVAALLRANVLARHSKAPVTVYQVGLGHEAGRLTFDHQDYTAPGNFGGVSLHPAGEDEAPPPDRSVPIITLDSLLLDRLDLLKADVEGMEPEVLRGAHATLDRCRPLLYLETDREARRDELLAILAQHGYRHCFHNPPLFRQQNFRQVGLPLVHLVNVVSVNLVGIPNERPRYSWEPEQQP